MYHSTLRNSWRPLNLKAARCSKLKPLVREEATPTWWRSTVSPASAFGTIRLKADGSPHTESFINTCYHQTERSRKPKFLASLLIVGPVHHVRVKASRATFTWAEFLIGMEASNHHDRRSSLLQHWQGLSLTHHVCIREGCTARESRRAMDGENDDELRRVMDQSTLVHLSISKLLVR